jgi:large subunit ribosomal protein L25
MSEALTLAVNTRTVIGKQVNQLRTQGLIPGVVYGPTRQQPLSVQVPWTTLRTALKQAGGREIISLQVEDGTLINVLVRDVQRHPVRGDVLHIDFYAVDVNIKLTTRVSIHILNEEATSKRLGTPIIQRLDYIEIETLPTNIPARIDIDLAKLRRPGDYLSVADLPPLEGITYNEDPETIVVQAVAQGEEEMDEGPTDVESMEVEVIGKRKEKEVIEDEE